MAEDTTKNESESKVEISLPLLDCMDKSKEAREAQLRRMMREYIDDKGGVEALLLEGNGGVPKGEQREKVGSGWVEGSRKLLDDDN